jgi:hypothetical protein
MPRPCQTGCGSSGSYLDNSDPALLGIKMDVLVGGSARAGRAQAAQTRSLSSCTMFLRPSRRPARLTSGLSATPVPIPTFRPERPSGMHRDADRRHRHAQRGISLMSTGTAQPVVGQTLGCAVQVHWQRLPAPSRALPVCHRVETHQTRPCPRNHRPERVRT